MAKDKKKIIVYSDWIGTFESLSDEEAGKLIKHFFRYVNDLNPTSDRLTELLFTPIKQTLKRDLEKWEVIQERNRENGKKGGRPKNPLGYFGLNKNPEKGDSVSVSVSVINKEEKNNKKEEEHSSRPKLDINGFPIYTK
jgi:hypothetical protein